jgi:hypothetical protein
VATSYVVLKQTEEGLWHEIGEVEAYGRDMAIRMAIDPYARYMAVSSSQWHMENALEPRDRRQLDRLASMAAEN